MFQPAVSEIQVDQSSRAFEDETDEEVDHRIAREEASLHAVAAETATNFAGVADKVKALLSVAWPTAGISSWGERAVLGSIFVDLATLTGVAELAKLAEFF